MAKLPFAQHTNILLEKLPYWFNMRKHTTDSQGAEYLNISGTALDDALYTIDYAYQQCYIDTVDIKQIDFCFSIAGLNYKGHHCYQSWIGGILSILILFIFTGITTYYNRSEETNRLLI